MSKSSKPAIVFCHGLWADGSCFNKVIPTLLAEDHQVMAVQYGLTSFEADVAAVMRAKVEHSRAPFDSFERFVLPSLLT